MTAQLIDGNALALQWRARVAEGAAALHDKGITPGLAVVLVGDNPASQVYVRNKVKACQAAGLHSVLESYPATLSEAELLARIAALNTDVSIHGILVQLPLPAHIDAHKVIEAIAPEKDVDGFHVASAGALMTGSQGFIPCTPRGCMKMLESIGMTDLRGKHAVVLGRSNIVGKPMALLLLASLLLGWWACTVTAQHLRVADPGCIVWDEILAFWLVLWLLPQTGLGQQLAAFIFFRLFDAAKPPPVRWADRHFKGPGWRGGWGILFDDLVAALCVLALLALWPYLLGI